MIAGGAARAVFTGGHGAELRLDAAVEACGDFDGLFRVRQVFLIGEKATIVHDAGKTEIQRLAHIVKIFTMIQMYTDRNGGSSRCGHHNRADFGQRGNRFMQLRM